MSSFAALQSSVDVIGAGRMGKIRARILCANPRSEFLGVLDSSEIHDKAPAGKYRIPYFKTFSEAAAHYFELHKKIDAVYLNTPTFTHKTCIV